MSTRVFTFWTGPQPPIIGLCLKSIARHCPTAECWTLERWREEYDDRLGPWRAIAMQRPNVQSDILRAWLLTKYGGIWIDADFICFRDLAPLWQHIEAGQDVVTYRVPATKVCTALMAAKPDSHIMHEQCRRIALALRTPRRIGPWALGPRSFARAIVACPGARVRWVRFRLIHPRPWWTWGHHRRALASYEVYQFHPQAFGFMLTHKAISRLCGKNAESELLADLSPIGQALRKAFDISSVIQGTEP